mgnify:CR=1 FL=1
MKHYFTLGFVGVALVVGGYFVIQETALTPLAAQEMSDTTTAGADNPTSVSAIIGQELIERMQVINAIKLRTEIFTDPVFLSLVDYSVEIAPEGVGRINPFAPVPGLPTTR